MHRQLRHSADWNGWQAHKATALWAYIWHDNLANVGRLGSGQCVNICPVCRQDVGAPKWESTSHTRAYTARQGGGTVRADGFVRAAEEGRHPSEQWSLFARIIANTSGPSMLLRPMNNSWQNYNAIQTQSDPSPTWVLIDQQCSAPTIMQHAFHEWGVDNNFRNRRAK